MDIQKKARELLLKLSNSLYENNRVIMCFSKREIDVVEKWLMELLNKNREPTPTSSKNRPSIRY